MQIVQINEKDVIDTIMLLLEHPLGESDRETINMKRVAKLCSEEWGLWRTATMNLNKVRHLAAGYPQLSDKQKTDVAVQVEGAIAHDRGGTQVDGLAHARPRRRPGQVVQGRRRGLVTGRGEGT